MLLLKPVYFYTLGYLITYLIIRYKVYIGEYQRKIKEEFSIIDIKANHCCAPGILVTAIKLRKIPGAQHLYKTVSFIIKWREFYINK